MNLLENWWSTPIYTHDFESPELDLIQAEIAQALPNIELDFKQSIDSTPVWTTFRFGQHNVNDIERFKLDQFRKGIGRAVGSFVRQLNYQGPHLRLVGSWTTRYEKGGLHFDHIHPYTRLSGVYYYKTNGHDGNIRFQNPNTHMCFGGFPADGISMEHANYAPRVGRIILFPSWLTHRVDVNTTDNTRISIAFNLA